MSQVVQSVIDVIRLQEAKALELEKGAKVMTQHGARPSAFATAAVNVARADGIRDVTMHLRGAFNITVADLPEAGSPAAERVDDVCITCGNQFDDDGGEVQTWLCGDSDCGHRERPRRTT